MALLDVLKLSCEVPQNCPRTCALLVTQIIIKMLECHLRDDFTEESVPACGMITNIAAEWQWQSSRISSHYLNPRHTFGRGSLERERWTLEKFPGKEVMNNYTHLYVNDKEVFGYLNAIDAEMLYLFSKENLLHLTGKEAAKHVTAFDIEGIFPESLNELEVYIYSAPARVLKDRLNVLGFGEALTKESFEESLKDNIKRDIAFMQMHSDKVSAVNVGKRLKELQKLDYNTWIQQLHVYIASKRSTNMKETQLAYDENPLEILRHANQRVLLWTILEHIDEEALLRVHVESIGEKEGDWRDEQNGGNALHKSWELSSSAPIIITEGTYDVQVLKGAIEILKPHLASYIRFLDYDFGNEGGASVAVKTLKSFAAAGISNRIVAIFDNDSAAYEAVSTLKGIKLPPQYKVIHYPDIALANKYPTLGPQGNVTMNVNGLAGSIELYLGTDVLKDDEGNLMPVQWKGYMSKIKSYQGEILNKSLAQDKFKKKLKAAKTDRKNVDKQDWSGLNAVLETLIETLSKL